MEMNLPKSPTYTDLRELCKYLLGKATNEELAVIFTEINMEKASKCKIYQFPKKW